MKNMYLFNLTFIKSAFEQIQVDYHPKTTMSFVHITFLKHLWLTFFP